MEALAVLEGLYDRRTNAGHLAASSDTAGKNVGSNCWQRKSNNVKNQMKTFRLALFSAGHTEA